MTARDREAGAGRGAVTQAARAGHRAGASAAALAEAYGLLLLDLDGTVYRGAELIDGAAAALDGTASRRLFVTKYASRTPGHAAVRLTREGARAAPVEVVTS